MHNYKIIAYSNRQAVEEEVSKLISDGWVPQGGISYSNFDDKMLYVQAMVRFTAVRFAVRCLS